jgi:hypothetical protein
VIGTIEENIRSERFVLRSPAYLSVIEKAQDYRIDSREILSTADGLVDKID